MKKLIAILAIILLLGGYLAYIEYIEFFGSSESPDISELQSRTPTEEGVAAPGKTAKPEQQKAEQAKAETETKGKERPTEATTDTSASRIAKAMRIVADKEKERYMEARKLLTDALLGEEQGKQREKIKAALDKLNKKMVFSRLPTQDSVIHIVEQRDTLWKIARKYRTTPGMVMMVNQKARDIIRVGERLKILKGKMALLIDYSDFSLTVLLNGHYVKQYEIGIGKDEETRPTGKFVIETKKERPTWYAPDGKVYPYGHPDNILGTRWLGFKETDEWAGYGIHGTDDAASIGKAASEGCVRLLNEDVEELFKMVPRGTEVEIRY